MKLLYGTFAASFTTCFIQISTALAQW